MNYFASTIATANSHGPVPRPVREIAHHFEIFRGRRSRSRSCGGRGHHGRGRGRSRGRSRSRGRRFRRSRRRPRGRRSVLEVMVVRRFGSGRRRGRFVGGHFHGWRHRTRVRKICITDKTWCKVGLAKSERWLQRSRWHF